MQFYLNGFQPGDPEKASPSTPAQSPELPEEVDVLVVGSGPAGTVLAAQLAEFPDITTRVIERREGPLELGHADGVACRTVEMFGAFGLAERLTRHRSLAPGAWTTSAIQSASGGSVLLIPREGGYMVRLYVDLGDLDPNDSGARSRFTSDMIIEAAQRIFHPYSLEVKDIAWWSVYEVGQRIADRFDDVAEAERGTRSPHVFIAGDACHTHSAKAGQGMNVSMQDGFNLGWKLAAVLQGRSPSTLLDTYAQERQAIAQELIDFDLTWSEAMAAKPADPNDPEAGGMSAAERQEIFTAGGRFTAGFATDYPPNLITGDDAHEHLATGFPIGERFHSAPTIRLADAKPLEIGHQAQADGRWRLYAFADDADPASTDSAIRRLCDFLAESPESPVRRYTPAGADPDAVFDVRAIFQQGHRELSVDAMPQFLLPRKGRFGLIDYEKMFCADLRTGPDIFDVRGIDRSAGALVIVRPDQYVAQVLPLDAHAELVDFFSGIMVPSA
ncbi:3-hydroxybenzoate 4-monooxygenase [Brevibacterium aurantiacum]|uniref:FAD-dependent monooxygenase n=3 Tax=Brevibacterium aurantiacum TaxID=273384 RepID=UPI000DF38CE7|nr:FAD-dependent monooxygenase [Brevibacterium aurantiacum]RCS95381.1 3-hydroxybenzoate 4-monooxygenase [Brevibacterium aurantiacum]